MLAGHKLVPTATVLCLQTATAFFDNKEVSVTVKSLFKSEPNSVETQSTYIFRFFPTVLHLVDYKRDIGIGIGVLIDACPKIVYLCASCGLFMCRVVCPPLAGTSPPTVTEHVNGNNTH